MPIGDMKPRYAGPITFTVEKKNDEYIARGRGGIRDYKRSDITDLLDQTSAKFSRGPTYNFMPNAKLPAIYKAGSEFTSMALDADYDGGGHARLTLTGGTGTFSKFSAGDYILLDVTEDLDNEGVYTIDAVISAYIIDLIEDCQTDNPTDTAVWMSQYEPLYVVSSTFELPNPGIGIRSDFPSAADFYLEAGGNCTIFSEPAGAYIYDTVFEGIKIFGNADGAGNSSGKGIDMNFSDTCTLPHYTLPEVITYNKMLMIHNISVRQCSEEGLNIKTTTGSNVVTSIGDVKINSNDALYDVTIERLPDSGWASWFSHVSGVKIIGNVANTTFRGNVYIGSGSPHCFWHTGASANYPTSGFSISGWTFDNPTQEAINLEGYMSECKFNDNKITNFRQNSGTHNTYAAVKIGATCQSLFFDGNYLGQTGDIWNEDLWKYGFQEVAGTLFNHYKNNDFGYRLITTGGGSSHTNKEHFGTAEILLDGSSGSVELNNLMGPYYARSL